MEHNIFHTPSTIHEINQLKAAIYDHAIVSITNPQGIIIEANDKFYEFSGYNPADILGKTHQILKSGLHSNSFYQKLWDTIQQGMVWHGEICNKSRTGEFYWFSASISPILDTAGNIHQYIAIRTDITKHKKQSQELKIAIEANTKSVQAKNNFLNHMSHEIRTPMHSILGMTSLLMDTHLNSEQKEYATAIHKSSETLLNTIQNILDYSNMESGQMNPTSTPFEISSLIQQLINTLHNNSNTQGCETLYYISPLADSLYHGDSERIHQLLLNLCQFTLQFSKNNCIAIQVHPVEFHTEQLQIQIVSTQSNLSPELKHLIIGLINQGAIFLKRELNGIGVGLTFCKKTIDFLQGHIEFIQDDRYEIQFQITLPLEKIDLDITQAIDTTDLIQNKHLLILDAHTLQQDILSLQFQDWHISPTWLHNPVDLDQLLSEAKQHNQPYHAIIQISNLNKTQTLPTTTDQDTPIYTISSPIHPHELLDTLINFLIEPNTTHSSDHSGEPSPHIHPQKALNILVAEDNPINRQVASGYIKSLGHQIDVVQNGFEVLNQIKISHYDLILMDIQMPYLDGLATTKKIRQLDNPLCKIPIIAMTANTLVDDPILCKNAGMNDYIAKPMDRNSLKATLNYWEHKIRTQSPLEDSEELKIPTKVTLNPQVRDLKVQENLESILGTEVLNTLTKTFYESASKYLSDLSQLEYPENFQQISVIAHTLKGSAANLGFDLISTTASTLEFTIKENSHTQYPTLISNLIHSFQLTFPTPP